MKVEFELTIDSDGRPVVAFRHHDKCDSLEQKLLGVFVKEAGRKGLDLVYKSGRVALGTTKSWDNYELKIRKK